MPLAANRYSKVALLIVTDWLAKGMAHWIDKETLTHKVAVSSTR